MKLLFTKNTDSEIEVKLKTSDGIKKFDYIQFVKHLINNKHLDSSEIASSFTEAECKSINSMVSQINSEVKKYYEIEAEKDEI